MTRYLLFGRQSLNVVEAPGEVPSSIPSLPVYFVKTNLLGKYNGSNNFAHLWKSLAYMWRAGLRGRVLGRQNQIEFDTKTHLVD